MITFCKGNMFDCGATILVNTVNCVGVMGKGVALDFKSRYPDMFRAYRTACDEGKIKTGSLHIWQTGDLTIINFPTKQDWRSPSEYEWIADGLKELRAYLLVAGKDQIVAVPALGCGNGGLNWRAVSGMISDHLFGLEADIRVYDPVR